MYSPLLIQVALSASALNKRDAFILDLGKEVYLWTGSTMSRMKRTKALELGSKLKREHASNGIAPFGPIQVLGMP
jgi:hypothetical protein